MLGLDHLLVAKNQPIRTSQWNNLVRAIMEGRIVQGRGTRVSTIPGVATVINLADAPSWNHAWRATVNGGIATVGRGTVNGIEATINKVKLNTSPPPLLDVKTFDDNGRGWIAVELLLNMDPKTKATDIARVEVVQCANLETDSTASQTIFFHQGIHSVEAKKGDGRQRVRYPLVRLIKQGDSIGYFQEAYFNLQYANSPVPNQATAQDKQDNGKTVRQLRHFFWPR